MDKEQTISMIQILVILRKHIKAILGSTIIVTLIAAGMTFFVMTPKYSATTEILVNRKLSSDMQGAQFQQVQADIQMISTYKDIIISPTVLKEVNRDVKSTTGYPGSMSKLKKALTISNSQNSQVFSVTAKTTNPKTSAKIADLTAEVFKKKIGKIMSINNVSIVSDAVVNDNPVSPKKALNITIGVILGLLLGIGLAFLLELTDRTVSSEQYLVDELGLINLGVVNEIDQKDIERTVQYKKFSVRVPGQNSAKRRV